MTPPVPKNAQEAWDMMGLLGRVEPAPGPAWPGWFVFAGFDVGRRDPYPVVVVYVHPYDRPDLIRTIAPGWFRPDEPRVSVFVDPRRN